MMDDMAHDADHVLGKPPGIVRPSAIRGHRRVPLHAYAGMQTRSWRPKGPETRGTTACCIRSKSSRFYLHPFREGNGRTQRIFWTQIAAGAGFDLDWSRVTGAENDQASRSAMERQDFTELRGIFDRIVQPAAGGRLTPERMEQLRAFANLSSSVAPGRSAPSTSTGRSRRPTTPGREAEQGRDL